MFSKVEEHETAKKRESTLKREQESYAKHIHRKYTEMVAEADTSSNFLRDGLLDDLSLGDRFYYFIENKMSGNPRMKFYLLGVFILPLFSFLTVLWKFASGGGLRGGGLRGGIASMLVSWGMAPTASTAEEHSETNFGDDWLTSSYKVFQLLMSGGIEDSIDIRTNFLQSMVFLSTILIGLGVFAVLVALFNDALTNFIEGINQGHSKIAASGHTLILGWNDATARVVCQPR